jgi:hypothetical protein
MPAGNNTPEPLATNRPWVAVAGCLGGGILTGFVAVLVIAAILVFVFFPQALGIGPGATQTAITTAVGELRRAPALRVATRKVAVEVDASTPTEISVRPWILPIGEPTKIELGRTTAQLVVADNTVQYIVPFDSFAPGEEPEVHEVDHPDGRRFVVVLPPPQVDETLVEVQSDPAKRKEDVNRDWLDHFVGDDTARDKALSSVRNAVIAAARSETAMFEVREKARGTVAEMIRALLPPEYKDCTIEVRWTDDEPRESR